MQAAVIHTTNHCSFSSNNNDVDDSAVMRAVEAFLQDGEICFDHDNSELVPTERMASTSRCIPKARGPRVINRSRMRRRHELVKLRKHVVELEERLHAIKQARHGISSVSDPAAREVLKQAWQNVADCQREQRRTAEDKHEQLYRAVIDHDDMFHRMHRLLQKATTLQTLENLRDVDKPPQPTQSVYSPASSQELDALVNEMHNIYSKRQRIWSDRRLDTTLDPFREVLVTENAQIEAFESRILPFDVPTTARALWTFYETDLAQSIVSHDKELENGDLVPLLAAMDMPHYKGHAYGRVHLRQWIESDGRVVIMRLGFFDSIERLAGSPVDGFGAHHCTWTIVGPHRGGHRQQYNRAVSQIDTFEVTKPFRTMDQDYNVLAIQQFCIDSAHWMLDLELQGVENCLLEIARVQ